MEDNIECCDGIYSFRLFSKKATSNHATSTGGAYQTINLRSPTPHDTNPGFVVQYRPATYYFTGSTAAKSSEQYRQAAVAGEEIIQNLQTQWPGFEMPWRVTTIDPTGAKNPQATRCMGRSIAGKMRRRGKKRRMIMRAKFVAKKAEVLAARQALADKEVAWREKRARKNRENKVKRKEKEKLKKA